MVENADIAGNGVVGETANEPIEHVKAAGLSDSAVSATTSGSGSGSGALLDRGNAATSFQADSVDGVDDHAPESVEVLFRFRADRDASCVTVVGEFNDWSTTANPMFDDGDGFTTVVTLPAGRSYRYRFLVDNQSWENDWHADSYEANPFGSDNCVLDLRT